MMKDRVIEERIHTDHNAFPDRLELGRAGSRLTISFNADDEAGAATRVDSALAIRSYAMNALMICEEEIHRQALARMAKKP